MKKIIKQYKTIISDNSKKFDNEVNSHLISGWELLDNSYSMKIYSKSDTLDIIATTSVTSGYPYVTLR